jgi:phospholipase/carboxylesterase
MTQDKPQLPNSRTTAQGRLLARPAQGVEKAAPTGLHSLNLDGSRDGLLYVPTSYRADRPLPFVLMLHGAGGNAGSITALFTSLAEAAGILLLVPDSRQRTWDVLLNRYGPDVTFIDRALAQTFSHYAVDTAHLAIGGFSDGASYALSLGLMNGDLFTHIIAFSPGFMSPLRRQGSPCIYISHGTHDQVLPIDLCSRRIVRQLQHAGYDVRYHEFDGPHTVPVEVVSEAWEWFTGTTKKR